MVAHAHAHTAYRHSHRYALKLGGVKQSFVFPRKSLVTVQLVSLPASVFSSRMMDEPVSIHWKAPKEGWRAALRTSEGGEHVGGTHHHPHGHLPGHQHGPQKAGVAAPAPPTQSPRRRWMPKPPAVGGVALGRSDSHPLTLNAHVARKAAPESSAPPPRTTAAWGKQALWDVEPAKRTGARWACGVLASAPSATTGVASPHPLPPSLAHSPCWGAVAVNAHV